MIFTNSRKTLPPEDTLLLRQRVEELERLLELSQQEIRSLRESEQRYRLLAENGTDLITLHDPAGNYLYASPSCEQMIGYTPAELIGRSAYEFFHPDDLAAIQRSHRTILEMLVVYTVTYRFRHKQGHYVWIETTSRTVIDEQTGEVREIQAASRNVHERKLAEEENRRLQEEMIAAQAATLHELSTPLIPISDSILVMPLIGTVDSQRAERVLETLLRGIETSKARVVIIDITGVVIVDSQVANALLQAAQAAQLIGARVVLTGIRPEVAQTVVGMGADLSKISTRATLQSGIAYALNW